MFKRILVCTDGSDTAERALDEAVDLARKFKAELVVVNVLDVGLQAAPYMTASEAGCGQELLIEYAEQAQREILERTKQKLESASLHCTLRAEVGQPVDRIVIAAKEESADLIVLGSRGLGGFQRLLVGSVSDGVVHHAHCPVLIVR